MSQQPDRVPAPVTHLWSPGYRPGVVGPALHAVPPTGAADETGRLVRAARAGDEAAFTRLTGPYRRELQVHCYRMLGSLHDAEDAVQETLLRAWRRLETYEGRASFRSWLYKIATNICLDALQARRRRLTAVEHAPAADPLVPVGEPLTEVPWLEPYPDRLLEGVAEPGPEARYTERESVELAFVAAVQHLPPRQRAVLLLRDVLDFSAKETAALLETSVVSANSALQRARETVADRLAGRETVADPAALDEQQAALARRYLRAWVDADIPALLDLLTEDGRLAMPPYAEWYSGRAAIAAFMRANDCHLKRLRGVLTSANGQPAVAVYAWVAPATYEAFSLHVLTFRGPAIEEVTAFVDRRLFVAAGLPVTLRG